jgi:hypothetical protein
LPRSPFTSPTAGCRLCISLSIWRPDLWRSFYARHPASTGAGGQTAMPERRVPIQYGWRGFRFYALYSRRTPGQRPFFTLPVNFTAAVEIARNVGVDLTPAALA